MDLDMAAAVYAAGGQPLPQGFARSQPPQRPPPGWQHQRAEMKEEELEGELPNVDDLEVAAAAAGVAPVPPVLAEMGYFELGMQPEREEDSSSEEESEESSSGEDSGSDDEAGAAGAPAAGVRLQLQLVGPDAVALQLLPAAAGDGMDAEVAPDSEFEGSGADSSSSSSEEEEEEEAAAAGGGSDDEPLDVVANYEDIKKMIDDMDADEEGGGADPAAHRAEAELLGGAPLPSLAALEVAADEPVQAAGSVQSMLEGMIVIKAEAGSRALSEGCVLVLEDRTPIGCIEEIFGPVMSPFYALRYAGQQPMPASLEPGATIYSVDRLADFVLPEALRVRGYDAGPEEEEDVEAQFSDDEAEARHRQQMKAKRKEAPEGLQLGGRGPKQAHAGRGGRGGGGRGGGRGGRGRGGGQQPAGYGMPPGMQQQQQQQQAFYHPHQQGAPAPAAPAPAAGRVFSGRLPRGQPQPPPPGFQAHATAAQLTGMTLQQPQLGGGFGGFYGGAAPLQQQQPFPGGQMMRPQYAAAPPPQPQRRQGAGAVMSAQYAGPRPALIMQPGQAPMLPPQQVPGMPPAAVPQFTPALPFPPPPAQPPQQ